MIIGSTAIKYWFPDFPRNPKDIDIVKNSKFNDYFSLDLKREYLENPILLKYCKNQDFLDVNSLYTLKISHSFWDLKNGSWEKHMWDLQWLKEKGCKFIPELFYKLYEYWNTIHGVNKRSKLDMSAEEFFDNVVNFPIEHDELHELLVKHEYFEEKIPTYKKILKEGADVDVSEEKFNKLTEKEKFNLVIEEVMVMSLERFENINYKAAFEKMLKKFILSHCPIWEGIWIIQHHKELIINLPFNHFKHLKHEISTDSRI